MTIASTSHLATTVAMSGDFVSNGNLVFPARHRFLRHLMAHAQNRFSGKGWNSLGWYQNMVLKPVDSGPVLLTETLIEECHLFR